MKQRTELVVVLPLPGLGFRRLQLRHHTHCRRVFGDRRTRLLEEILPLQELLCAVRRASHKMMQLKHRQTPIAGNGISHSHDSFSMASEAVNAIPPNL